MNEKHMRETLLAAAEQFMKYAYHHAQKGDEPKASVNALWSRTCAVAAGGKTVEIEPTIDLSSGEKSSPENDRDIVLRMLARSANVEHTTIGGKAYWAAVERLWGVEPTVALPETVKDVGAAWKRPEQHKTVEGEYAEIMFGNKTNYYFAVVTRRLPFSSLAVAWRPLRGCGDSRERPPLPEWVTCKCP